MEALAATALLTAMERARESARSDRLFDDRFAGVLAGPEGEQLLSRLESGVPSGVGNPAVPIRTRFFDDALLRVIKGGDISQVVLLGAGMDTRAFRLPLPAALTLFEVDTGEVLALKQHRLAALAAEPRCQRVTVAADLTGDGWASTLCAWGFSRARPSVWLAEGLLVYLENDQVHRLLARLGDLAAAGSSLLADVIGRSFLDSPWMRQWLAALAASGSPWRFATDDPEGLLAQHGWQAQVTQLGDDGANFGRWPFPVADRGDLRFPHSYLVLGHR